MAKRDDSAPQDAAQAFEHLTQEVSELHHEVEELVDELRLKEQPDYSPTLGEIAKDLGLVRERLDQVERHPALRLAPAQFGEALSRAGSDGMREVVNRLDQARQDQERTTQALAGIIGSAHTQDQQIRWLKIIAAASLVAGLFLSPLLARLMPFGLDGRIAAIVMAADRWNAGAALMEAQSPQGWRELAGAGELVKLNTAAIAACRVAALKLKQPQRCTIEVPPAT